MLELWGISQGKRSAKDFCPRCHRPRRANFRLKNINFGESFLRKEVTKNHFIRLLKKVRFEG